MIQKFKEWLVEGLAGPETPGLDEALQYHLASGLSVCESIFRPGSKAHQDLMAKARRDWESGRVQLGPVDERLFSETDLGLSAYWNGTEVALDFPVFEAEYHGKSVELGKPARGGAKKYHVYVKNPATGKVKKISFGDVHGGLTAKVSNPAARKSFAARHQCHLKTDRMTAGYWACRINRYSNLWGGKTYPGFW